MSDTSYPGQIVVSDGPEPAKVEEPEQVPEKETEKAGK